MHKEVVENGVDEYIMGHGKEVEIEIDGTRVNVLAHSNYGAGAAGT